MSPRILLTVTAILVISVARAQNQPAVPSPEGYSFTEVLRHKATPVKNQARTSTCWSFSTASLLESELLRTGKGEYDLSEMFVVRQTYLEKARQYVRMHGNVNFAPGGAMLDIFSIWRKYGLMPDEAYPGMVIGEEAHIHGEMDAVLKGYLDALIKNPNRKLTPVWEKGVEGILDAYLGKMPESFSWKGKLFTAPSFAASFGGQPDDYPQLTSFTHHPFYTDFIIELPDNWAWGKAWNLPLNELMETIDHALQQGYTVAWAADVSERGFSHRNGVAIVPETKIQSMEGTERSRWEQMTQKEKDDLLYGFKGPVKERKITQEVRQEGFDNQTTTDDHGMHIIGLATDQAGNKYYIVKNSWGTDNNPFGGYLYVSEAYVRYKTISVVLHKNGIPRKIRSSLLL